MSKEYYKEYEDFCRSIYVNPQQIKLLVEVSKQNGNVSSLRLSRKIYLTAVSGYNNLIYLKDLGLINIMRKQNMNVCTITEAGEAYMDYYVRTFGKI